MKKAEALTNFKNEMMLHGKSPNTVDSYHDWAAQYIDFIARSEYKTREERVSAFLTYLVIERDASKSTQKQALCALILFYSLVVKEDIGKLNFRYSSKPVFLPTVLSREEAAAGFDQTAGSTRIQYGLMYGCGLRLNEVCSLRVMDIDIDRRQVHVHQGKGAKDRKVPLPEGIINDLMQYLRVLKLQFEKTVISKNPVKIWLPGALAKKYPLADSSWGWYWLFPASGPIQNKSKDTRYHASVPTLFHVHKSAVQKRIHRAFHAAGIAKKTTCHTLRHSFATHWLENAEGSHEAAIIRLQKLMGHADASTTMIYLHCIKIKTDVPSPLDTMVRRAA